MMDGSALSAPVNIVANSKETPQNSKAIFSISIFQADNIKHVMFLHLLHTSGLWVILIFVGITAIKATNLPQCGATGPPQKENSPIASIIGTARFRI